MSDFVLKQTSIEIQTAIDNALKSDASLSIAGKFADAKATGDAIAACEKPTDEQVSSSVNTWLNEHPEATTTVLDGTITTEKLANNSVTTEKISDGAVTSEKISDGSVTAEKLGDDVKESISSDAVVKPTAVTTLISSYGYTSGTINSDGSIATNTKCHSDLIPVNGTDIEVHTMSANYNIDFWFYDAEQSPIIHKRIVGDSSGVVTVSGFSKDVAYIRLNDVNTWLFGGNERKIVVYTNGVNTKLADGVAVDSSAIVEPVKYENLFDKENMLLRNYNLEVGKNLDDYKDSPAYPMWVAFFPVRANTNYTVVCHSFDSTMNDFYICDYAGNIILRGTKNEADSPVTVSTVVPFHNGKAVEFSVKDNLPENAKYLGFRYAATDDYDSMIIYEGSIENYKGYVEYKNGNGFNLDEKLLVSEKNLNIEMVKTLAQAKSALTPENIKATINTHIIHSREEIGTSPNSPLFSIGSATTLFNTARFAQDIADSNVKLSSLFAHVSSFVVDSNGLAYCVFIQNTLGANDSPTHNGTGTYLVVVDLNTMEIQGTYTVAVNGNAISGAGTISIGAGDPNVICISDSLVRITFTAKSTDGNWYLLYRDFNTTAKTFGNINIASLKVDGNTYPFATANFSTHVKALSNTDVPVYATSQYSKNSADGYYYIGVGFADYLESGSIFRTTDFVTFELWLLPEIANNAVKYEVACYIYNSNLYCAFRQRSGDTMLVAKINLSTKAVMMHRYIDDTGSRGAFFVSGSLYLMHSTNGRATVQIDIIDEYDTNRWLTVGQGYQHTYPCIVQYGENTYITYTRQNNVYIGRFTPVPYNRNNTIAVVNKLLDLLGNA